MVTLSGQLFVKKVKYSNAFLEIVTKKKVKNVTEPRIWHNSSKVVPKRTFQIVNAKHVYVALTVNKKTSGHQWSPGGLFRGNTVAC